MLQELQLPPALQPRVVLFYPPDGGNKAKFCMLGDVISPDFHNHRFVLLYCYHCLNGQRLMVRLGWFGGL